MDFKRRADGRDAVSFFAVESDTVKEMSFEDGKYGNQTFKSGRD